MADSYPDAPDYRIAYDRDGTQGVLLDSSGGYKRDLTSTELTDLNNETLTGAVLLDQDYAVLLFPVPLDISGLLAHGEGTNTNLVVEASNDTTNGSDGTWTAVGGATEHADLARVDLRNDIDAVSEPGVTALRFKGSNFSSSHDDVVNVHIYGQPTTFTNKLDVWHPTLDQRLSPADLDWGDDPRGHVETAQLRIKNNSSTETASSIELSIEALSDIEFRDIHQFSADDVSYSSTLNIGSLAPGAISAIVYVRKSYTLSQPLSVAWARIIADATGGWS